MHVENIKPHIGAVVHLDRSQIDDRHLGAECMALLEDRGVLVFPELGLDDEEQLRFTEALGPRLNFTSRVQAGQGGTPGIFRVSLNPEINRQQEYIKGTYFWHMDGLTVPEQPPKATLLSGRMLSDRGGETQFCNTYAGYATLPASVKEEIDGLRVIHDLEQYLVGIVEEPTDEELARWRGNPKNEYPLVWHHDSGRASLVLGATASHVAGMDLASGKALLARLLEWTAQPDFSYAHTWRPGDLVLWNNYGVLHRVTPYPADSGRQMHRTTIEGTELLHA